MRILFLTNLLPYPLDNGGRIKTYTTLLALKSGGHCVDLICFTEEKEINKEYEKNILELCDSVKQIYNKITTSSNMEYMFFLALRSLLSSYPLSSYKFISNELKSHLKDISKHSFDVIYFDHLPMYVYYKICKNIWPKSKIILDEHNCETVIMQGNEGIATSIIKKTFIKYEVTKLRRFERKSILSANKTLVLTYDDYYALKKIVGRSFKHVVIPIGVSDKGLLPVYKKDKDSITILFLATLTWGPNVQGLLWFLKNVIPTLDQKLVNYKMFIVGKKSGNEIDLLTKDNKRIVVTGYVDSVDPYYEISDCMVVPLFVGSGQRVKILEAFSRGFPVVSTEIGASGIDYKDDKNILIANDEKRFVEQIIKLQDYSKRIDLSTNSRKLYESVYSVCAVKSKILKAIECD